MKEYYEAHITFMTENKNYLKQLVEDRNWKFSCIDDDPVLGDGVKCYATRQFNLRDGELRVINTLNEVADAIEFQACDEVKVIRRKVERIIYDKRSKDFKCDGTCCIKE